MEDILENPYQKCYNTPAQKAGYSTRNTRAATQAASHNNTNTTNNDSDDNNDNSDNNNHYKETDTPFTDQVMRELRRLDTSCNPTATNKMSNIGLLYRDFALHSAVESGYNGPSTCIAILHSSMGFHLFIRQVL